MAEPRKKPDETPDQPEHAPRDGAEASESPFTDVTAQVAKADEEAGQSLVDERGEPREFSTAGAEVAAEMSRRSSAAVEGGGPFPEEIVRDRYVGAPSTRRGVTDGWTSHEQS